MAVVHVFTRIKSKGLLIKVTVKMKRLHTHIRARDAGLQERPEILKAVRVYAAIHVLNGMIHNLVCVICRESFIREQSIGVESRASFYILTDFILPALTFISGANGSDKTTLTRWNSELFK